MGDFKLIAKLYSAIFLLATVLLLITIPGLPDVTQKTAHLKNDKKDWHNYTAMEEDSKRVGIGEQGRAAFIRNSALKKQEKEISLAVGYNGLLSDRISVNRSLRDIRNEGCKNIKYLETLPSVSIVIPFYNEHFSVLMRSVHSLINRSSAELLREIILVDDASESQDLQEKLDMYIAQHFTNVLVIRLGKRIGLIGARLAGAHKATSAVLVFMDSHIEATYNWLPPLLEPIALNTRTAVCPFIDVIDDVTFEYSAQDEGARGAFNWIFDYKRLPLLVENRIDRTTPFENPVMAGGLFAISAEFFWELGGYDEGLEIWGGEQYELSFKIWMCGGRLLDAPCSRVGHIYKGRRKPEIHPRTDDYIRRNYKRVAEVWMDDYKRYLYEHDQSYKEIDTGDISKQKALRKKLQCKSFDWYMKNVAFDLTKIYPTVEPPDYANGAIQSLADPSLCIDTLNREPHERVGLFYCCKNLTSPQHNQNWALSAHRDVRLLPELLCLSVKSSKPNAVVLLWECHEEGGDQFWYYNPKHKWIVFERNGSRCLEAVPKTRELIINDCDPHNKKMSWNFGFVNTTALGEFFNDIPEISYLI